MNVVSYVGENKFEYYVLVHIELFCEIKALLKRFVYFMLSK